MSLPIPPIPNHLKIVTVAQMQALERAANEGGHSYARMMERAGAALADLIRERFPAAEETPVLALIGPGNNGGDGLVCARHLHDAGYPVRLYIWKRQTDAQHDYQEHFGQLAARGVESIRAEEDRDFTALAEWLHRAAVVVDGLLGTGSNRPIEGTLADLLDQVEAVRAERRQDAENGTLTLVAVDCPSGMDCDTGALDPHTVRADVTLTFAYAKAGHFLFPAAAALGQLAVADIGIALALADEIQTFALSAGYVAPLLPARPRVSHKGSFGKGMAIVGSVNYPGAAYLSCAAMGRVGAGLVTGAVPQPVWVPVATALAEPTWLLLSHELGVINENAVATINEKIAGYSALLLGCGLTHEDATVDFVRSLLTRTKAGRSSALPTTFQPDDPTAVVEMDVTPHALPSTPFGAIRRRSQLPAATPPLPPAVIDADGLNCLALLENWPEFLPDPVILTPHAGEMARLCGLEIGEVRARGWQLAQEKAAEWHAVVLLKGPYTVIASPDGRLAVLPVATPALATAGTGDVLAGTITGLLAQGVAPFDAACLGAWLHGRAGEVCEEEIGPAGAVAGDLLGFLPSVMNELRG